MKLIFTNLTIFFLLYFIPINLIANNNNIPEQKEKRYFKGFFRDEPNIEINITILKKGGKLSGSIQKKGAFKINQFEGTIQEKTMRFEVYMLDIHNKKTAKVLKGRISNNRMRGTMSNGNERRNFDFTEVENVASNNSGSVGKSAWEITVESFPNFELPSEFLYNENAEKLNNLTHFLSSKIEKVGSYNNPIFLGRRINFIKKAACLGKVKMSENKIGIILQVHYIFQEPNTPPENRYEIYYMIYDKRGNAKKAFVVYEKHNELSVTIKSKMSSSHIFEIRDMGEIYKFKIADDYSYAFRNRE